MQVIAVATPQAKPGVHTIPLLERPADLAGIPFDRMIHTAKVPPSAMRFCCRARVVEEPSALRWLLFYRSDSQASSIASGPIR